MLTTTAKSFRKLLRMEIRQKIRWPTFGSVKSCVIAGYVFPLLAFTITLRWIRSCVVFILLSEISGR